MEAALVDNLVRFEQALRRSGILASGGRMPEAVAAVEAVGVASRTDVRAALRSVLVNRREDLTTFDRLFDLFWRARQEPGTGLPLAALGERPRVVSRPTANAHLDFDDDGVGGGTPQLIAGAYSVTGLSPRKDFGEFTPEELERAAVLFDRLDWRLGLRRSRRWTASPSGAIDLRSALGRSRREFGELLALPRRRRMIKPRPLIVLADVSGSMERYSRVLLQFVYAVARRAHRVESFVFATRLTRVTRAAAQGRAQPLDRSDRAVGAGLGRRHAHWRSAARLQRALGEARNP